MAVEAVERAVDSRFKALFEVPTGISVDYGQPKFEKPNDKPWCRLSILGGLDVSVEIDATSHEEAGIVSIQIFTPKDERKKLASNLYDKVAAVFREKIFNDVHTLTPNRTVVGVDDGWWQENCSIEWEKLEVS